MGHSSLHSLDDSYLHGDTNKLRRDNKRAIAQTLDLLYTQRSRFSYQNKTIICLGFDISSIDRTLSRANKKKMIK